MNVTSEKGERFWKRHKDDREVELLAYPNGVPRLQDAVREGIRSQREIVYSTRALSTRIENPVPRCGVQSPIRVDVALIKGLIKSTLH